MILRKKPYLVEFYNIKVEDKLSKLGFKRCWFQDKSGYWYEYTKKHKLSNVVYKIYVEVDRNIQYFSCYFTENKHQNEFTKDVEFNYSKVKKQVKLINKICQIK